VLADGEHVVSGRDAVALQRGDVGAVRRVLWPSRI
jgi:hypothetical protein